MTRRDGVRFKRVFLLRKKTKKKLRIKTDRENSWLLYINGTATAIGAFIDLQLALA